jgi:hypothetical protein
LPLTLRIRALRERPDGRSGPNFWINTCISSRAAHPFNEVNEFASSIKLSNFLRDFAHIGSPKTQAKRVRARGMV